MFRVMRRARLAPVLGATATLSLGLAALGQANHAGDFPEFSDPYTQKTDGDCFGNRIDPINVYFKGDQAGVPNSARNLEVHAGWTSGGGVQNLRVNVNGTGYDCRSQWDQRASGCGTCNRFHTRLWLIPATLDEAKKKTAADAHHEWTLSCGHAVDPNDYIYYEYGSGFDWARTGVLNPKFENAGHTRNYESWGNTRTMRQCNEVVLRE